MRRPGQAGGRELAAGGVALADKRELGGCDVATQRELKEALGLLTRVQARRDELSRAERLQLQSVCNRLEVLEIRARMRERGVSLGQLYRSGKITEGQYKRIQRSLGARKGGRGEERRTSGRRGDYVSD